MLNAGEGDEHLTLSQEITTNHEFSKGALNMEVTATVLDDNGNLYVSGTFRDGSTLDLGCGTPTTNPSGSLTDSFLAKFDDSGACLWQRSWGSTASDPYATRVAYGPSDLALDGNGEVVVMIDGQYYTSGIYSGFPPGEAGTVRKINAGGTQIWQDTLGSVSGTTKHLVAVGVDDASNITVTGYHNASFKFGGASLINNTGGDEVFVLNWDSSENRAWGKTFGGVGENRPVDLAVHKQSGDIAVAGNYTNAHRHLNGTNAPPSTTVATDVFIQVLNKNGGHKAWKNSEGNVATNHTGSDYKRAEAIAFTPGSNAKLYLIGTFRGQLLGGQFTNSLNAQNGSAPLDTAYGSSNNGDTDWFVVGYFDTAMTFTEEWEASGLADVLDRGTDIALSVDGPNTVWAFSGAAKGGLCGINPDDPNCAASLMGFAEVIYGTTQLLPATLSAYSQLYPNQSSSAQTVDLDYSDSRLVVSGELDGTNKNLGGGALSGSDDFVVSYSF